MTTYDGLHDRVALVTGAGRGLGEALARGFAAQGSRVALVDVDEVSLRRVAASLDLPPERLLILPADLADVDACEALVASTIEHLGGLDILVNNAAIIARMPLEDIGPGDFDRVIAVNLRAPFFLARAALEPMRQRGWGRIVNVASMAARTGGTSDVFLYAASKGGLLSITKSLAKIAAPDGVLVNAVLPSNIESPMLRGVFPAEGVAKVISAIPLGRTAAPAEVAELILWLSSDAASYVSGANWDINGGWFMT